MLVNLTPHEVNIWTGERWITVPPAKFPARVVEKREPAGTIEHEGQSIKLGAKSFYGLNGIPSPEPGVWYIVSTLVALAAPNRKDLIVPLAMRDPQTKAIIGAEGFDYVETPK